MKIRIDREEKVQAAIDAAQARARVRTVCYSDVVKACERVMYKLDIPKKHMNGIKVSVDVYAADFPNAYAAVSRTKPQSTIMCFEFKNNYWYLVDVFRGDCRCENKRYITTLTEDAKTALIKKYETFI